jgi:hypothetical protein
MCKFLVSKFAFTWVNLWRYDEDAERRARARDAGEALDESDSSDDDDDEEDDDDDFLRRDDKDEVPTKTHEEKLESGLAYPVWHTKVERKAWRAGVSKNAPGASIAFAAAVLEDAAGPFLYAVTHRAAQPVHRPEPEEFDEGPEESEEEPEQ